jgi:pimeloyl-ACP methyl ester carboxylesterase
MTISDSMRARSGTQDGGRPLRGRRVARGWGWSWGLLAAVAAGAVVGLAALVGTAAVSARPALYLGAGPVVFLHGGPGIADMAGDAATFTQLTGDGFDLWVYDQVGTGHSSRLADPRGYTIAREVADLEAIRQQIGADRMVLLGHSWGGQVAAAYLAAHPGRVARVVFSSPGALAPAVDDGSGAGARGRLTTGQRLGLYRLLARPRVLLAWTLLQVQPPSRPCLCR